MSDDLPGMWEPSDLSGGETDCYQRYKCSLCHEWSIGYGNNPEPLRPHAERCCNTCNMTLVVPARAARMERGETW